VITIDTDSASAQQGTMITVVATNSGGKAVQTFALTVNAVGGAVNMLKGEFDSMESWNHGAGFSVSAGSLLYTGDASTIHRTKQNAANMETPPTVYGIYDVEVFVNSISGASVSCSFKAGGLYNSGTITPTNGPNGDGTGLHSLEINWTAGTFEEFRVNAAYCTAVDIDYVRVTKR
jgi:hypothetical protein